MANIYGFKNRSGKQCRERWHNHLDPNINKDYWSEKEENILFMKHIEYGNKWSDIAKFLPGRTDNAIKNHFYSKLRKFIRKILKLINKDNLLKNNNIDVNKYNSDKVYKIIKKFKIPYNTLTKDSILNLIINFDKNSKNGKVENTNFLLKQKTSRKKSIKDKENLYSEKINKRKCLISKYKNTRRESLRLKEIQESSESEEEKLKVENLDNDVYSVKIKKKGRPIKKLKNKGIKEEKQEYCDKKRIGNNSCKEAIGINRGKRFSFSNIDINNYGDSTQKYFNIIINKNILRDIYNENENNGKEKENKVLYDDIKLDKKELNIPDSYSQINSTRNINNIDKTFNFNNENFENSSDIMDNKKSVCYNYGNTEIPQIQFPKINNNSRIKRNLNIDTSVNITNPGTAQLYNKNYQDYFMIDPNKPLISPINYHPHMFPVSTKNHFNINMDTMMLQNLLDTPTNIGVGSFTGSFRIPTTGDSTVINPIKEINMQDKILIHEPENISSNQIDIKNNINRVVDLQNIQNISSNNHYEQKEKNCNYNSTPKFKAKFDEEGILGTAEKNLNFNVLSNKIEDFEFNKNENVGFNLADSASTKAKEISSKRFSLDLDVVNQSDTTKIFSETVNNYKNDNTHKLSFCNNEEINNFEDSRINNSAMQPQQIIFSGSNNDINLKNLQSHKNLQKESLLNKRENGSNIFCTTNTIGSNNNFSGSLENKRIIFSTVHAPTNMNNLNNTNFNLVNSSFIEDSKFQQNSQQEMDFKKFSNLGEKIDNTQLNTNFSGNTPNSLKIGILNKYNNIIPMISPNRASLNISPKSAFVFNKKLFN